MTVPPRRSVRNASTASEGSLERLARVLLHTLPSWRNDSRRRMQGLESRLGTTSMYMGTHDTALLQLCQVGCSHHPTLTWVRPITHKHEENRALWRFVLKWA